MQANARVLFSNEKTPNEFEKKTGCAEYAESQFYRTLFASDEIAITPQVGIWFKQKERKTKSNPLEISV